MIKKIIFLLLLSLPFESQALTVYSYEQAIDKINSMSLEEIDSAAEKFAIGEPEFIIKDGAKKNEFYKLINKKIHQVPRVQRIIKKAKEKLSTNIRLFNFENDISTPEMVISFYALLSLVEDSPEIFAQKYPKYIKNWKSFDRNNSEKNKLGMLFFSSFQMDSIYLGKENETTEKYISYLGEFKDNSLITSYESWSYFINVLTLSNPLSIKNLRNETISLQQEMIFNYIKSELIKYSYDQNKQLEILLKYLSPIVNNRYPFSFYKLDEWFNILLNRNNLTNIEKRVKLLNAYYDSRQNWELKITKIEYIKKTISLIEKCNSDSCKLNEYPALGALYKLEIYIGDFKEADRIMKKIKEIEKNIKMPVDRNNLSALDLLAMFQDERDQGHLYEADQKLKQLRSFFDDKKNFNDVTPELYQLIKIAYDIDGINFDILMGRLAQAREKLEQYISIVNNTVYKNNELKIYSKNIKQRLLYAQAKLENSLKNKKPKLELLESKYHNNQYRNNISIGELDELFWLSFNKHEYKQSLEILNKIKETYNQLIKVNNIISTQLYINYLNDEQNLIEDCIQNNNCNISQRINLLKRNSELFVLLENLDLHESDEEKLNTLYYSWLLERSIKNINYSNYLAKKYINLLQVARVNLKNNHSPLLNSFSNNYKDTLQVMSEDFFIEGNIDVSNQILNIIKENQLVDFAPEMNRSGIIDTYIKFNDNENFVNNNINKIKIKTDKLLRNLYLSKTLSNSKVRKITSDYNAQINQMSKLLKKLNTQDNEDIFKRTKPTNLVDDSFILIQSIVSKDETIFRLSTKEYNSEIHISIQRDKIRELIYKSYDSIVSKNNDWNSSLSELKKIIFDKLNTKINALSEKKIYFIPDDALVFLPTDFLFATVNKNIQVINLLNTKHLVNFNSKTFPTSNIDVFAATKGNKSFPPLPSAKKEAIFIGSYKFNDRDIQHLYIDDKFTKETLLKSLTSKRDVIHIATHFNVAGETENDVGLLIGDGALFSLKDLLSEKKLYSGVSLLTLSACQTAVSIDNISSQSKTFEGFAGLFAIKGVSQILATLWKVSDNSTMDFMKVFYLLKESEGLDSSSALLNTKLIFSGKDLKLLNTLANKYPQIITNEFIKNISKYTHPFYWSGFILVSSTY